MRLGSLSFWLGLVLVAAATETYGNFSLTCSGVALDNSVLSASCSGLGGADEDTPAQSRLDLALCIGLDQVSGRLQWEIYGKYPNYCKNCTILNLAEEPGHLLSCSCTPLVGGRGPIQSTLNLDEGIRNEMGTLRCEGGIGSIISGDGQREGRVV
ncbi:Cyanovirin-N [Madurella mycetomatis]|uniref:Cyanovirin-N n=1 Tax=Madurella mycetomatis TaxID=100816 RepID=A0A175W5Z9_9PEZI|nr:Cyanovirin-N [Madurella mycetomatis]